MAKYKWTYPLAAATAAVIFPLSSFAIAPAEGHGSAAADASKRSGFVLLVDHFNFSGIMERLPDPMEPTHRQLLGDRLRMHAFPPENPIYIRYDHHALETTYLGLAKAEPGRARLVGSIITEHGMPGGIVHIDVPEDQEAAVAKLISTGGIERQGDAPPRSIHDWLKAILARKQSGIARPADENQPSTPQPAVEDQPGTQQPTLEQALNLLLP
jgi:hypothetical protein